MDEHTTKERRLKIDILKKNVLRKKLQKRLLSLDNWTEKLTHKKNKQHQKRLHKSITRYQDEIEPLKKELLELGDDLEKRIKGEMSYSEEEIKAFQESLDQETKTQEKAKKELEASEKKDEKKENAEKTQEKIPSLKKLIKEEIKKVKTAEKELKSEEHDKALFTLELKRIAMERKLYSN